MSKNYKFDAIKTFTRWCNMAKPLFLIRAPPSIKPRGAVWLVLFGL